MKNSRNSAAVLSRRVNAAPKETHRIARFGRRSILCTCGDGVLLRGIPGWTQADIENHLLDWYNRHRVEKMNSARLARN